MAGKGAEKAQAKLALLTQPVKPVGEGVVKAVEPGARLKPVGNLPPIPERPALPKPVGPFKSDPTLSLEANMKRYDAHLDEVVARDKAYRAAEDARADAIQVHENVRYGLPPNANLFDFYKALVAEEGRQRELLRANRHMPDRTQPTALVQSNVSSTTETPLTPLETLARGNVLAEELHEQLTEDARSTGFFALAEKIKAEQWGDTTQYPRSIVEARSNQNVKIDETTGEVIDRSFAGAALVHRVGNKMDTVFIGLGYVGDREGMPKGAKAYVSDEDLRKGAKAYILERTIEEVTGDTSRIKEKRRYVVPLADPEAVKKYVEFVYDETNEVAPNKRVEHPRRGRQQELLAA